jgi:hypothetical protein
MARSRVSAIFWCIGRIAALDEVGLVAVADEQRLQLLRLMRARMVGLAIL